MHLEQYLLSLYRKAFDPHQIPTLSPSTKVEIVKSPVTSTNENFLQRSVADSTSGRKACNIQADRQFVNPPINVCEEEGLVDPGVLRCQSSLSQYSTTSLAAGPLGRSVHACYSQPSSMVKVILFCQIFKLPGSRIFC